MDYCSAVVCLCCSYKIILNNHLIIVHTTVADETLIRWSTLHPIILKIFFKLWTMLAVLLAKVLLLTIMSPLIDGEFFLNPGIYGICQAISNLENITTIFFTCISRYLFCCNSPNTRMEINCVHGHKVQNFFVVWFFQLSFYCFGMSSGVWRLSNYTLYLIYWNHCIINYYYF